MRSPRTDPVTSTRWWCAAFLCLAAAAHIPLVPEHLHEALYMGVAFVVFVYACLATAAFLVLTPSPRAAWVATGLGTLAVLAYVATRVAAFPRLSGDVGEWFTPLGIIAVVAEVAAVATAALALAETPSPARPTVTA